MFAITLQMFQISRAIKKLANACEYSQPFVKEVMIHRAAVMKNAN